MAGVTPTPIVALDVSTTDAALALVDRLGESCRFYKVGSELFTAAGPSAVSRLREAGCDVFLDLKYHDIPTTVAGAVRAAAAQGVRLLTVHAAGGAAMLEAAVAAAGDGCGVLAVTVLTSLDAAALAAAWGRETAEPRAEVLRLAGLAARAGARGVVCGGNEAADVRGRYGAALELLIPGIRVPGQPAHDQARAVAPAEAAAAGATYIVLGRAVTAAPDPPAALRAVRASLASTSGPNYR